MADKKITRQLSIFINDREVVNSLGGVEREMAKVRAQQRQLVAGTDDYDKKSDELRDSLKKLKEEQSAWKDEIQGTNEELIDAGSAFGNFFNGLRSGNFDQAKEGLNGIRAGIVNTTKAALAFIATPIGAAIAALVAIGAGAKALWDYNIRLAELNKELTALGVTKEELSAVRSEVEATAKTYDKEFTEIASRAKSLKESFGVTMSEANDIIARGLADGGAKNKEFFDSIGEYDVFFAKAGYSAQEFINIINAGFDADVYTDKLPDALKEADISLREQTTATRDALVNAFGANFTNDILQRVKLGETTTKDALEEIALKSREVSLNQQQDAQLTADVFRGAGEDAGGALKILETVGAASQRQMSEAARATDELREANERLAKGQAALFEIEGFGDAWIKIKTAAINFIAELLEGFADIKQDIQPLIDVVGVVFVNAWNSFKNAYTIAFNLLSAQFRVIGNTIGTLVQFVKKLLEGDFTGALDVVRNGVMRLKTIIASSFGGIANSIISTFQGIVKTISPVLDALGVDVEKLQKRLENFKYKPVVVETQSSGEDTAKAQQATAIAIQKAVEDQIAALTRKKNRLEALGKDTYAIEQQLLQEQMKLYAKGSAEYENASNQLLKLRTDHNKKLQDEKQKELDALAKGEAEINALIAKAQQEREVAKLSGLQKEIKQIENKYAAEIEKHKEHTARLKELEVLRDQEIADAKAAKAAEYGQKIADIDKQLERDRQVLELEKQAAAAETDEQKQSILLEKAKLLAQWELEDSEAKELGMVEDVENAEDLKDKIREKYAQKRMANEQRFAEATQQIEKKKTDAALAEEKRRMDAIRNSLNQASELFNKGTGAWKAIKIAEAAIATYQAAMNAYNSVSKIPVIGHGLGLVAAATATAMGIKNMKAIAETKISKAPKFFKGGFTGTRIFADDEYGGMTGVTHPNEWVAPAAMTQNPRYANVIGWLEGERIKLNGGTAPSAPQGGTFPAQPNGLGSEAGVVTEIKGVLVALLNRLDNPVAPVLAFGYQDVEHLNEMNNEITNANKNGTLNS